MKKVPIKEQVLAVLDGTSVWESLNSLTSYGFNHSTLRRVMNELGDEKKVVTQTIPGSRYRCKQYASLLSDTSTWADAQVTPTPKRNKPRTVRSGVASITRVPNPRYQGFPMCLPDSTATKLTLIQAVGDLVTSEFIPAAKKFTAHDVTKRLREKVSADPATPISPVETGSVHVQGKSVPKIEHEDVKAIVHELFAQGLLVGFDRVHVAGHFEYDTLANIAALTPPAPIVMPQADPMTPDPTVLGTSGSTYDGSSTI